MTVNLFSNVSKSPLARRVLAQTLQNPSNQANKDQADLFATLLRVAEALVAAPANSPQSGMFLSVIETLRRFAGNEAIGGRLRRRKKWMERLEGIEKALKSAGEKEGRTRGAGKVDEGKLGAVRVIMESLGSS